MNGCTKECYKVFHLSGGYHRTDCALAGQLDEKFLPENVELRYTEAELQELKRQNALEVAAAYDSAVRTTEERCNAELQEKQMELLREIQKELDHKIFLDGLVSTTRARANAIRECIGYLDARIIKLEDK